MESTVKNNVFLQFGQDVFYWKKKGDKNALI